MLIGITVSVLLAARAAGPVATPGPLAVPLPVHVFRSQPLLPGDTERPGPTPPLPPLSPLAPARLDAPADSLPADTRSRCVGVAAPGTVTRNERFTATVTFLNTGTLPWTSDGTPHKLGSVTPQDNIRWGVNRVELPGQQPVHPGQTVTFSFTTFAPAGPGAHPFAWRMVEDSVEWFGETCRVAITVVDAAHGPATAGPPSPAASFQPPPPPPVVVPTPGDRIRIPAINVDVPLVLAPSMRDPDVLRALQSGVVRYPNGVDPGRPGVLAIAGHSSGFLTIQGKYRFAFINARELNPGDVIYVDNAGTRYTYRVTGQRIIDPRTVPYLETAADRPRVALISCWPIWTVARRLIVDAELQSTAPIVVRPPAS